SPATRTVSPSSNTTYTVTIVTDANCSNSGTGGATVTIDSAPTITSNPTDQTVCTGSSVSFTAAASGNPTPNVQWQVSTIGGANAVCTGSSGNTYTVPAGMSSYSWSISGNGTISGSTNTSSVSVTAGAVGSFTLTLAIADTNGCASTCTKPVTVDALPACS